MQSNLSLSNINLSDLSILYVLIAVVILLALIAAIGAWVRGGGLKREDAESLFSESRDRNREEISRLEQLIAEVRESNQRGHDANNEAHNRTQQNITARLQEVDQQVQKSRSGIEAAVVQAATDHNEALSDELEMVARKLGDTERRVTEGLSGMDASMKELNQQVTQAGLQLRQTLQEITRQQQEQKAQSTIQLCEALITSLGTLKSSIVHQLDDSHPVDTPVNVDEEPAGIEHSAAAGDPTAFASDNNSAAATEDNVENASYNPYTKEESEAASNPSQAPDASPFENEGEADNEDNAHGDAAFGGENAPDSSAVDTESEDEEEYPPPIY